MALSEKNVLEMARTISRLQQDELGSAHYTSRTKDYRSPCTVEQSV